MLSEDFKRFKSISDVRISPDGKRILFVIKIVDEKEDDYSSHIWEVLSGGGNQKQFTYGDGRDFCPRWSPDGKKLAMSRGAAVCDVVLVNNLR
jgi:Tol biopolymer transport system component